jgi:hypothetical protein
MQLTPTKSALVKVFTPEELASTTNQGLLLYFVDCFEEPIHQHITIT